MEHLSPAIAAVIFDMDGLLFDTERIALHAWQNAGKTYGVDIPEALIIESVGRNTRDTKALFECALGQNFDFVQTRKLRIAYAEEYIRQHGVPIKSGVTELLDLLSTHGVPCAVATSTERTRAEKLLMEANIRAYFDAVICGDDVQQGKPAPDIFLCAAQQLQVAPERCYVLEDSESGIRAAVSAHMTPILIPDIKLPSDETQRLAAHVFPSLCETTSFFADLLLAMEQQISTHKENST